MPRSVSALKWSPDGTSPHPEGTEMDWRVAFNVVRKRAHDVPYAWVRVQANHPERLSPALLRRRLDPPEGEVQVHQVLSGTYRYGDIPPRGIVTNDFEVDRGLVRLERQKNASGEKPLWDTWVRFKPPATLGTASAARQARYDRDRADTEDYEKRMHVPATFTEDDVKEDEFMMIKNFKERTQARRDWHFEKLDRVIDERHARRENKRLGEPGLREWQVADALRKIRESRERHQAFANGRSKS